MADKYFVDTNILIYAHDRSGGIKHERARQLVERLWTTGQGVLSTQVLQELCVNLRRRVVPPVAVDEIRRLIQDYLSWEVIVNTPEAVLARAGNRRALSDFFLGRSDSAGGGELRGGGAVF